MKTETPKLFVEINNSNFIYYVIKYDENENLKIVYKLDIPLIGIENKKITDYENFFRVMKENIYLIENL